MDSSKRRLSGAAPTGPASKRPSVPAGPQENEEEPIEEQVALLQESPEDDADDIDQHLLEEDLELHLGEAGRNWERPAPAPINPATDSLGKLLHMPKFLAYLAGLATSSDTDATINVSAHCCPCLITICSKPALP